MPSHTSRTDRGGARGRTAERPGDIPAAGWKDVAARVKDESKEDAVPLLAAGVAFFGLLASVPTLIAVVSIYGLVADPTNISSHVQDWLGAAPPEARTLVTQQLRSIVSASGGSLSIGVAVGIVVALWSASSGMKHLIQAINLAYDEQESRGFLKLRLVSLGLTVGAILFLLVMSSAIALIPDVGTGGAARTIIGLLIGLVEVIVLFAAFVAGLAVLYRFAPDRDKPRWQWVSWGAVIAAVLWLVASLLFSLYTANFGKYNKTYGSLGGVIILLLWLMISAGVVILGAEINAELERQTELDSTVGAPKEMGERHAYVADTLGEPD